MINKVYFTYPNVYIINYCGISFYIEVQVYEVHAL
jgi:hypothetical protein